MTSLSEFSLIDQFFSQLTSEREDVELSVGDDCALLKPAEDKLLAVSIDTLIEGVHFFPDVNPESLGHKSLAVGLSDLAAMGATPAWFTLALTLPSVDEVWLRAFSSGLANLANQAGVQLVGGDTTHGPLSISIQVHGFVEQEKCFRRDAAKVGDLIYVTGTLGDAGAALKTRLQNWKPDVFEPSDITYLIDRLERPTPRLNIADSLRGLSHTAIDISDGLLADLGHILKRSQLGAEIDVSKLPLSKTLQKLDSELAYQLALSSGDDYELCFTINPIHKDKLESMNLEVHCIGSITDKGLVLKNGETRYVSELRKGYDHFT